VLQLWQLRQLAVHGLDPLLKLVGHSCQLVPC
jgi:hypothetical protein